MFEWLKRFFAPMPAPIFNLGANIDTRSPEQVAAEDIRIEEVVAKAATVEWKEIAPEAIRTFGVQNQNGKSDCVAESRRKIKRILFNVNKGIDLDFSAVAFYRKRANYPAGGMMAADAISIDQQHGMTLDRLVPSEPLTTEAQANALVPDKYNDDVAKVFAVQNVEVIFNPGDLETPAGTIQKSRKGIMMWFYATRAEWSLLIPTVQTALTGFWDPRAIIIHSVVGVEPALYMGRKGVWIDDSAHFGGLSRRFITEDFYRVRNFYASYPMAFKFEQTAADRPTYTGLVKSLQDCLKYEGVFPQNVDSTGVFGPITTQAVKDFQKKYGLEQVGFVGPRTAEKLRALYP